MHIYMRLRCISVALRSYKLACLTQMVKGLVSTYVPLFVVPLKHRQEPDVQPGGDYNKYPEVNFSEKEISDFHNKESRQLIQCYYIADTCKTSFVINTYLWLPFPFDHRKQKAINTYTSLPPLITSLILRFLPSPTSHSTAVHRGSQ